MTKKDKWGNPLPSQVEDEPLNSQDTSLDGSELEKTLLIPSSGNAYAAAIDKAAELKLLGRYEVRKLLGRGSFGAVFKGFDPKLVRDVAIKVPLISEDLQELEEKFLAEAQRLAKLRHHGIVAVFDVGVEAGLCYIVSEFLKGKELDQWLLENSPGWQQTVQIVAAIADALAHAHAQSTIHRDVKPGNVILVNEADGLVPKLVDFGLGITESHDTENLRGVIAGSPAYMSPEQVRGFAHRIDGRTDIYSLGVVLYEMLCGRRPFRATVMDDLLRQIREDAPQPPRQVAHGIPSRLEDICLKALSKKENDRFKTAGDMAVALREVLNAEATGSVASDASPQVNQVVPPVNVNVNVTESATATTSAVRRARDAERRQLTVMICNCDTSDPDISLASLDPEDQRDVLETFQRLCEDVINRFGGTVVQSTGQELLLCFGYPTAFEDAPHRAIRTGLGILEEMKLLNEDLRKQKKTALSAWAAIHTGMVVAGESSVSESQFDTLSIIGEARTVASRLEALTERDQIIISDATHRLVQGFFLCDSQGTQKIRGVSKPVELFEVKEEIAVRSRVELVDPANLTPLVGREMELGIIKDRWEHAVEGMGQVVLLIGEAGLGKSRMVREIKEHVASWNPDAPPPVIEWRCSAYHTGSSLFPVTEFFEHLLEFDRGDSAKDRLDKLFRHLQEFNLGQPEQVAIFASLLSIPPDDRCAPIELSPIRQKERTQELLLEWLREYSSAQPILFVIEDLHWVDPSTLEFLTLHVDQGLHDNVLTLLSFRPEFRTPWQQTYSHLTQVALTRLTKRQIGEMIKRKTGVESIPEEIIVKLADRTDGVPLFVEEFTQMIEESGVLEADRKGKDIAQALSAIPVTLQDLLTARLDRLDSNPDVVQLGATFGREFNYELLQAASDLEEEELQAELAKLVQAELLFQKGRPPKSNYIFKHALIQDAAYNSLLKQKRQQFHKRIAETFESDIDDTAATQPELLAHHFTQGGKTEKAVQYWLAAGQHAQRRSANTEAISHLTQGLQVLKTVEESQTRDQLELGFQLTLAPVLMAARGWSAPEVGTAIERAQQLVSEIGTVEDRFFVMWGLWGWRLIRADMDICQGIANDIMQLVEQSPEAKDLLSEAYWVIGCTAYYKGDFKTGLHLLDKGRALVDREKERLYALKTGQCCSVLCDSHAALALWQLGFPDQALRRADEMIQVAIELDHPFSYAMGLFFRRQLLQFIGQEDQATGVIEQEYQVCHENGFVFFEVHAIFGRGVNLLKQGRIEEAQGLFDGGLQMLDATGGNLSMDHPYCKIAEAYLLAGIPEHASEWLDRGFDLVDNHNERGMESEFLRLQGELALSADDQKTAEDCFQRAVEVARQQQAASWELRAMISFAKLRQSQGRQNEARQMLASTCSFFTEGFDTADHIKARSLLDELGSQA